MKHQQSGIFYIVVIVQPLDIPLLFLRTALCAIFPSECDKLRKDGFRSSQYYSQGPTFSSPLLSDGDGQLDQDEMEKKNKVNFLSTLIATLSSKYNT